jgi:hypothetical protein
MYRHFGGDRRRAMPAERARPADRAEPAGSEPVSFGPGCIRLSDITCACTGEDGI